MFNRAEVKIFVEKVREALSTIPDVQFDISGIRFSPDQVNMKLSCVIGTPEDKQKKDEERFKQDAVALGLSPNCLNAQFKYQGENYEIAGINLRRYKFPITAKKVKNGKLYRFSMECVRMGLKVSKRSDEEILKDLRQVYLDMSPENLTCDGELTSIQSRNRLRLLKAEELKLINELGRVPTEVELK